MFNDVALQTTEAFVAEHVAQHGQRVARGGLRRGEQIEMGLMDFHAPVESRGGRWRNCGSRNMPLLCQWRTAFLRPEPDFLPPPSCLLTVAQARASASSWGTPCAS